MAQQNIVIGTADAKQGDTLFSAFTKTEANFTELYTFFLSNPFIFVTDEDGFPTQDETTITLEANQLYWIAAPITTSKRFVCENNSVLQSNAQSTDNVLTYTGTGTMFTGLNVSFTIRECVINHPSGQGFDFEDNISNTSFLFIDNITAISGTKLGTLTNLGGLVFNRSAASGMNDGWTIAGSNFNIFRAEVSLMKSSSASFIAFDFGSSVLQTLEIIDVNMTGPSGAVGISGLAASGNIPAGRIAMVTACEFDSTITPLQNIVFNDVRWEFEDNNEIKDSRNAADTYLTGGTETVTISAVGTFVEIGVAGSPSVSWASDVADRFTVGTDGVITYVGEKDIEARISGRATVEKVGGGSDEIEVQLAKNWVSGSGITKSRAVTQNTAPTTVPVSALIPLSQNDDIRVIFANNTSTSDILAAVATLEITG